MSARISTPPASPLVELYRDIDRRLARRIEYYPAHVEPDYGELLAAIEAVAEELWQRSCAAPKPELSPAARGHLSALADRPVFVLGYFKSGTTLLLNLLDGHPELLALPSESRHFGRFLTLAETLDTRARIRLLNREWIRRLVSPAGLPPHWVLGEPWRTGEDAYELFSRHLIAFAERRGKRDLLAAVAQALAATLGSAPRRWVEKSPAHEFHLERIRRAYPEASFVHIVREPRRTIESILGYGPEEPIVDPLTGASELARSFAIAREMERRLPDRYLVLRYEDLVSDPPATMRRVSDLLGIGYDESLLAPTVLGRPAIANAGAPERRVVGAIHRLSLGTAGLDRRTRAAVDALAGREARGLGYDVPAGKAPVRLAARARLFIRYRLAGR